jgi:hypothetical protein
MAALLAADRQQGFQPSAEPPMRLTLVRLGREEYRLIWSHHHALLDGWSMAPLWQEVLYAYTSFQRKERPVLPSPVPYHNYLDWIGRQSAVQAESYWRERLAGFTEPVYLGRTLLPGDDPQEPARYEEQEIRLAAAETAALQQLARQNRLTLNTLVQGAWALVLARHSGREDVLFGVTTAGRPANLVGAGRIIGLMLNTLPLRVRVPAKGESKAGRLAWLNTLQEAQAEQTQYEYVSLSQVQQWSELPPERPLFESFLRFQNYPMKQFLNSWQGTPAIRSSQVFDRWHYPMSVVVVPEREMVLRIGYDSKRFEERQVKELLSDFGGILKSLLS